MIFQVFICSNQKGSQSVEHKKRPVHPFHWGFAREGEHCWLRNRSIQWISNSNRLWQLNNKGVWLDRWSTHFCSVILNKLADYRIEIFDFGSSYTVNNSRKHLPLPFVSAALAHMYPASPQFHSRKYPTNSGSDCSWSRIWSFGCPHCRRYGRLSDMCCLGKQILDFAR